VKRGSEAVVDKSSRTDDGEVGDGDRVLGGGSAATVVVALGRVNGFGVFDRSSLSVLLSSVSTALIFGVDAGSVPGWWYWRLDLCAGSRD